jgi:hypothetical protein
MRTLPVKPRTVRCPCCKRTYSYELALSVSVMNHARETRDWPHVLCIDCLEPTGDAYEGPCPHVQVSNPEREAR